MSRADQPAHPLVVSRVVRETPDAVTVTFDDPHRRVGGWAGAYVLVEATVADRPHRRPFSLSSVPELGEAPAITVKRGPSGLVSRFLVEQVRAGDLLRVTPATGSFRADLDPNKSRTFFAFAAGSGITPVMSILRGVLSLEPGSAVRLAYGNRSASDTIFRSRLDELKDEHADRLKVSYFLSSQGHRIDRLAADAMLVSSPPVTADVWYMVCGPPGLNRIVEARLRYLGVPEDRLLVEHYLPPIRMNVPQPYGGARVALDDTGAVGVAKAGATLLDALGGPRSPLEFACRAGVCGTCRARLVKGEVDPGVPFALTEAEQKAGVVLTCIARATTPEVVLRRI